jgi:hypothetical protein
VGRVFIDELRPAVEPLRERDHLVAAQGQPAAPRELTQRRCQLS